MSLTEWRKRSTSAAASTSASLAGGEERKALAKAAAWAWHQHSSSGDVRRAVRRPQLDGAIQLPGAGAGSGGARPHGGPTRYKLEALAAVVRSPTMAEPRPVAPITLLDVYEVERIKRELERLIAGCDRREDKAGDVVARQGGRRALKGAVAGGGFFGRHAVGICAVREGVAEAAVVAAQGRRKAATSTASSTAATAV